MILLIELHALPNFWRQSTVLPWTFSVRLSTHSVQENKFKRKLKKKTDTTIVISNENGANNTHTHTARHSSLKGVSSIMICKGSTELFDLARLLLFAPYLFCLVVYLFFTTSDWFVDDLTTVAEVWNVFYRRGWREFDRMWKCHAIFGNWTIDHAPWMETCLTAMRSIVAFYLYHDA